MERNDNIYFFSIYNENWLTFAYVYYTMGNI